MFTTLISLAVVSTLAVRGALADFTVNSPVITECGSTHITWEGQAKNPVNVIIVPAADPCDSVLLDLGDHSNGAMTFNASLAAGTKVLISLEDADGFEAWSSEILVAKGNDTVPCNAVASSSASVAPSGSAAPVDPESATTLVVPPLATGSASSSGNTDGSDGSGAAVPLGAVNQGLNPAGINGAVGVHKLSAPAVALTALAAVFAIAF